MHLTPYETIDLIRRLRLLFPDRTTEMYEEQDIWDFLETGFDKSSFANFLETGTPFSKLIKKWILAQKGASEGIDLLEEYPLSVEEISELRFRDTRLSNFLTHCN